MKKLLSIFLTLALLISNIGLTMATHYCDGEVVESQLMLISGDIGCGMEDNQKEDCENLPEEVTLKAKSCCDSDFQVFQIEDEFDSSKSNFNLNLSVAVILIQSYFKSFVTAEKQEFAHSDYFAPLLKQDKQVLFQTFLI